jgi:tripartite-type tricarboxylate transporter receptor subunit TctC
MLRVRCAASLFVLAVLPTCAFAQAPAEFPHGAIRIVVPNAPSTPTDIISRIIANELGRAEGWRVFVENRTGGVTTIAAADVLRQPPDGHTVFAMALPTTAARALVPNISYRLEAEFEPVVKVSVSYNVLLVNPALPVQSVGDLIALLKREPGKYTFSSGGFGTPAHLIGEQFKQLTGTSALHVPYQQFPQAIGDLLNGTNHFMFITMLPVIELIQSGRLRAIALTGPKRTPVLPDVPTIIEAGFPELVVEDWVGLAVRRGTPGEAIARLNLAVNRALANPELVRALGKLGAEPAGGEAALYGKLLQDEGARWTEVIARSGIKLSQ